MTQYAYPDDDPTPGNWTASSGSDRHLMIDDAHDVAHGTADNTHITVTDDATGDMETGEATPEPITLSLGSVTDPASSSDHKVRVLWYENSGMDSIVLNVNLKDGSTSIKNEDFGYDAQGGMNTDPLESIMTLNASQANAISEAGYNNLTLVLTATESDMGGNSTFVYRAYFECPDAAAAGPTLSPAFLMFVD